MDEFHNTHAKELLQLAVGFTILWLVLKRVLDGAGATTDRAAKEIRDRLLTEGSSSGTLDTDGKPEGGQPGDMENSPAAPADSDSASTYRVLAEYSAQGLAQSRTSFRASIAAATLGFAVIITGVLMAIFKDGPGTTEQAIVTVISGAVIDAVSALFFAISSRTQTVMVEFFDKLREDRKLEEALTLVRGVRDDITASRLQVLLALQFVGTDNLPDLYKQTVGDHPGLPSPSMNGTSGRSGGHVAAPSPANVQ